MSHINLRSKRTYVETAIVESDMVDSSDEQVSPSPGAKVEVRDEIDRATTEEARAEMAELMTALEEEMCARVELHVARYRLDRSEGEEPPDLARLEAAVEEGLKRRLSVEAHLSPTASWRRFTTDYDLSGFERSVLGYLFCVLESPRLRSIIDRLPYQGRTDWDTIGRILALLCPTAKDALVARASFAFDAALFANGLLQPPKFGRDDVFLEERVTLNAEVSAALLGDSAALTHLASCVRIERPQVNLDEVVLRDEARVVLERIAKLVSSSEAPALFGVKRGSGTVALFTGPPGTGKTLAAEAVATSTGRALVSFLGTEASTDYDAGKSRLSPPEQLEVALQQAHRNRAVLFIDECDRIFTVDDDGRLSAPELLTVIERARGLVIMATNKPVILDEALDRRVLYRVEFPVPTAKEREEIWRLHLPKDLGADDELIERLARRHGLTGGYIRNAVQQAVQSCALGPKRDGFEMMHAALISAARDQAARAELFLAGYRPLDAQGRGICSRLDEDDQRWVERAGRLLGAYVSDENVRAVGSALVGPLSPSVLVVGDDPHLLCLVAEDIAARAGLRGLAEVPLDVLSWQGRARAMELESALRLVRDRGGLLLRVTAKTSAGELQAALEYLSTYRVPVLVTWDVDGIEARAAASCALEARRLTTSSAHAGTSLLTQALAASGIEGLDEGRLEALASRVREGEIGPFLLRVAADLAGREDGPAGIEHAVEQARLPGLRTFDLFSGTHPDSGRQEDRSSR